MTADRSGPAAAPLAADELRREIGRTREDLGATVAALAYKADVKGRVTGRVRRWRSDLSRRGPSVAVAAAIGGVAAVGLGLVVALLRRHNPGGRRS